MNTCEVKAMNEIDEDRTAIAQIVRHDTKRIFIKIIDGAAYFQSTYYYKEFNITFLMNGTIFQLQHNALKWMQRHSLFSLLIDRSRFLVSECRKEPVYSIS